MIITKSYNGCDKDYCWDITGIGMGEGCMFVRSGELMRLREEIDEVLEKHNKELLEGARYGKQVS